MLTFGTDRMTDALKVFCREQRMDAPEFWMINPDRYIDPEGGCLMPYAAVLHLAGKDRWEEFEASAFFLLADFSERENRVYPFWNFQIYSIYTYALNVGNSLK